MDRSLIDQLCLELLGELPLAADRCTVGTGNHVYRLTVAGGSYALRCSRQPKAYDTTRMLLARLAALDIPVPRPVAWGETGGWQYLLLNWLEGEELGPLYPSLSPAEKRSIAREAEALQRKAAGLSAEVPDGWRWIDEVTGLLDRAFDRIARNGWFSTAPVARVRSLLPELTDYFSTVPPIPYLDDITTKNLLIREGHISGVIDVDWIGLGDRLTYAALTKMALLEMGQDTLYVDFLLEEMALTPLQKKTFAFYTLLYCVDFMGERGSVFLGKAVPVSPAIVCKLNDLFEILWNDYHQQVNL